MSDIMLDLETVGNTYNSGIIAIGAVKFDPATKHIIDRFYSRVCPQSCLDAGLVFNGSTFQWWLQQSEAARAEFKGELPPLKIALTGFTAWMNRNQMPGVKRPVWGNGATFDNVILTSAYNALKVDRPWSYRDDRCYRTLKNLYPDVKPRDFGTAHRADHDAEAQALHLMDIWPKLRQS